MQNNEKAEEFSPKFYKHIDAPVMILFFEADDMAIAFVTLFSLLVFSLLIGMKSTGIVYLYFVLAVLAAVSYSKFKKNKPSGYIFQFLYKRGYYHPLTSLGQNRFKKYFSNFKVAPQFFTKKMKGQ